MSFLPFQIPPQPLLPMVLVVPFSHVFTFHSWKQHLPDLVSPVGLTAVLGDLEVCSTLEGSSLCGSHAEPGPGLPHVLHLWGLCLDSFSDFEQGAHLACRFGHSRPLQIVFLLLETLQTLLMSGEVLDLLSGRFPDAGLMYWNILSCIPFCMPAKFHWICKSYWRELLPSSSWSELNSLPSVLRSPTEMIHRAK